MCFPLFVCVLQGPLSAGVQGGSLMVLCFRTHCMPCLYSWVGLFDVPPQNWAALQRWQHFFFLLLLPSNCVCSGFFFSFYQDTIDLLQARVSALDSSTLDQVEARLQVTTSIWLSSKLCLSSKKKRKEKKKCILHTGRCLKVICLNPCSASFMLWLLQWQKSKH